MTFKYSFQVKRSTYQVSGDWHKVGREEKQNMLKVMLCLLKIHELAAAISSLKRILHKDTFIIKVLSRS